MLFFSLNNLRRLIGGVAIALAVVLHGTASAQSTGGAARPAGTPGSTGAAASTALAPVSPAAAAGPGISWLTNLEQARQQAATSGKPIFLYCYTPVALACRDMEQKVFTDPTFQADIAGFIPVAVNVNADRELARKLALIRVPSVYFMDATGKVIDRAIGFKPAAQMSDYARRALASATKPAGDATATAGAASATDPSGFDAAAASYLMQPRQGTSPVSFRYSNKSAKKVFLTGDFVDWRGLALPMKPGPEGTFEITIQLYEGVYNYKFYVQDTNTWEQDPAAAYSMPDNYGGKNSVVVVGNPVIGPRQQGNKVTFLYYNKEAKKVELAGTFNDWKAEVLYSDGRGSWGVILDLKPGTYEYKYCVDGTTWLLDPINLETIENSGGYLNSKLVVK